MPLRCSEEPHPLSRTTLPGRQVGVGVDVIRPLPQCDAQGGLRLDEAVLPAEQDAEIVVSLGKKRLQANGLAEGGLGFLELALHPKFPRLLHRRQRHDAQYLEIQLEAVSLPPSLAHQACKTHKPDAQAKGFEATSTGPFKRRR